MNGMYQYIGIMGTAMTLLCKCEREEERVPHGPLNNFTFLFWLLA